jgi:chromosome segregation ATPase
MAKDFKELINSVEEETKSRAELEHRINSLKEEINKLEFTIKEQKVLIENLKEQMKDDKLEQSNLPSEIDVLKDIISAQRKELENKDEVIENLDQKISELSSGIEDNHNEEFLNAQHLIVQLTDENELYKDQIEELQIQLDEIKSRKIETKDFLEEERAKGNEELTNFKRLNFQLMEENGLLRVELESLKLRFEERLKERVSKELELANESSTILSSKLESLKLKLQEQVETNLEELEIANEKTTKLTTEIADYKAQVKDLQERLLTATKEPATEDTLHFTEMKEELDDVKSKLLESQEVNQTLNEILSDLRQKISSNEITRIELEQDFPKRLSPSVFYRMYNFLDDDKKLKLIDSLIQDLNSNNSEIKRNAIRILSVIKNNKVYNAFLEMLNDQDWLVRYSVIKALSKFEKQSEELKPILKKLSKDSDVDVRELASRILEDLSS